MKRCKAAILSQVFKMMAAGAQGNEVAQSIGAEPAAGLQMVDLQVAEGTT
jgi:hypothetical protein